MAVITGLFVLASIVGAIQIAKDMRDIRKYHQERARADKYAWDAVYCHLSGDDEGAKEAAQKANEHREKALDIMVNW